MASMGNEGRTVIIEEAGPLWVWHVSCSGSVVELVSGTPLNPPKPHPGNGYDGLADSCRKCRP